MELLVEYVSGPRKGQRVYVSTGGKEKMGGAVKVVAEVHKGTQGRIVPIGIAGESNKANGVS